MSRFPEKKRERQIKMQTEFTSDDYRVMLKYFSRRLIELRMQPEPLTRIERFEVKFCEFECEALRLTLRMTGGS